MLPSECRLFVNTRRTCVLGYLNCWNDTIATTLEAAPLAFAFAFATQHLAARGWQTGKHEPGDE